MLGLALGLGDVEDIGDAVGVAIGVMVGSGVNVGNGDISATGMIVADSDAGLLESADAAIRATTASTTAIARLA